MSNSIEIRDGPGHDLIKALNKAQYTGYRNSEIFDDWLAIVEATLERLPAHAASIAQTKRLAEDPPDVKKLFERLHEKYKPDVWDCFAEAFAILTLGAESDWEDYLGSVYMAWGYPSVGRGQFFTPWNIAYCMAQINVGVDAEQQVHARIKAAIEKSPLAQAMLFAGCLIDDPGEAQRWYFEKVIPACAEFIEPITVCDPAVGSGVMLLAAASCYPRWVIDMGLVQFYGMDIDQTCVSMCKINCMLHGLNGYFIACADASRTPFVAALRETLPLEIDRAYSTAESLTLDERRDLSFRLRNGQYDFFGLTVSEDAISATA
jgi:hypothetical protein